MICGQETELVYLYNPGYHTGPKAKREDEEILVYLPLQSPARTWSGSILLAQNSSKVLGYQGPKLQQLTATVMSVFRTWTTLAHCTDIYTLFSVTFQYQKKTFSDRFIA